MGQRIYLDDRWGFTEQFSVELTKKEYAGSLKEVRLPHTCKETPLHYFDESIYQMVSGYRRILFAPAEWKEKRIRLTFDGVGHACRVFLNGEQIGEHHCGYTAFSVELTGKLRIGEDNVLAVEVDSRETLNEPPFGFVIDYMTFGGIYRDVYLDLHEEAFLEDVFISTVQMTGRRVRSRIKVNSASFAAARQSGLTGPVAYQVKQFLRRKDLGEYVFLGEKKLSSDAELEKTAKRASRFGGEEGIYGATDYAADGMEALGEIVLWDVENPALYQLKTQLFQGDVMLDERVDVFGFRTARFRRDGFYLNGRKLKIRGLNRHQSYPYIGYAAPKSLQVNDAEILKRELGVNAVRTSHYPQSHYFLDRCDELGLLVFTEMPGWQHIGDEEWKEQAVRNVRDMILQYRNHPSIIIWGVRINESMDDDDFYVRTNAEAKRLDPTRQTGGVRAIKKSHLLEDVYTYNEFVHEGNNKGCEPKKNVTSDVTKPYLITEYNGHMFPTKAFDCEDRRVEHALRHANVLEAVAQEEDVSGSFGWCMFDYNTHKDFGSGDRICYHGVMDAFRNPKLAAAVYQSQQDDVPTLMPSSSMDIGEHPGCNRGMIYLFTNADSVKMYKNGEFVQEYRKEDSPYPYLPHGPLVVDDFVGDVLVTKEGMKPRLAKEVKKIMNEVARVGLNNLSLETKLASARLIAMRQITMERATELYNKYVGDWGGTSTAYRFEAIKDGKVVKTVEKQPMHGLKLFGTVDHVALKEDQTYDAAAIRIQMQDEFGNLLSICNDPVSFEVQGEIELIGPSVVSLQGGMTGTYVRTLGKSGSGKLLVKAQGAEPLELDFKVEA
ncbi:MAG: glycoside hydrolase family 2 protein [Acetatifactor sp.]|nr:glycoside hydrolase family 2 protein [Acetatifactor sp.]